MAGQPNRRTSKKPAARKAEPPSKAARAKTRLLSGGNPQIAMGDGEAPVRAYIAAMPGWKRATGARLDSVFSGALPDAAGLRKAVKWNSPFYGVATDDGRVNWFLSFHCFAKYIKVGFFCGASLRPMPPGESKQREVRYLDVRETDVLDEQQLTRWVRQASKLPGWVMERIG